MGRHAGRGGRPAWLAAALAALVLTAVVAVVVRPGSGAPTAFWGAPSASPADPSAAAASAPVASSPAGPPVAAGSASPSPTPGVPAPRGPAAISAKKGVSAWYFDGAAQALRDVRAAWYYTWAVDPGRISTPAGIEFVPMMWGAGSVNAGTLARAAHQGRVLLGFNEPDFGSQANMSVTQALDLWPQLMATGLRLGSPAPATGAADAGGWLDRFMTGAATRGYRVDFIALHWYGADFSAGATDQLRRYLDATYQRYHKPIWLTEYALIRFGATPTYPTPAQQADFIRASTAMLEHLTYLERYAWFALPTGTSGDGTGLYRTGNTPTTAGAAYRAA